MAIHIYPDMQTTPYHEHVPAEPPKSYVHVPWHGTHHVQVGVLRLPNSVEWLVCQICHYARIKKAWRYNPVTNKEEYAVEFTGCTDGFQSVALLMDKDKLRQRVRRLLLQQVRNANARVGIGHAEKIRIQACGNITFDEKRMYVVGELLTPDGAFITRTAFRRKGTHFQTSLVQQVSFA